MSKVQIEYVGLDKIKPYWNNPRDNESAIADLKKSIQQYDFLVPIVVDSDGVIVTGHTRFKASVELELLEVPIIRATHLTPEQVRAFRIADNRLSENAKWDEVKLGEELRAIQDMGFNLEFTGFSKEELDCLCGMVTANCLDDLDYKSVCGEVEEKVVTARGAIMFSLGNYKFYLSVESYKKWEAALIQQYPKRTMIIEALMDKLGFQPAERVLQTKKEKTGEEAKPAMEGSETVQ